MSWLKNIFSSKTKTDAKNKKDIPQGVWTKCGHCQSILYRAELERHLNVCPKCHHHMYISAQKRLRCFFDSENFIPIAQDIKPIDHLKFRDTKKYKDRLQHAQKSINSNDALLAGEGALLGMPIIACAFEYAFIGGSMGSVVGEVFVQAAKRALEKRVPFICFTASGGARMQEGLLSLMQMSKTSAVLAELDWHHIPFISVLTHPTMGGVSASLAMLGDIIIAEPKALIGFAGPRVVKETVREVLPDGFQRSEFLLEHGAIDMIVTRSELRVKIAGLISKLTHQASLTEKKDSNASV